ncbi:MAG: sugar ABC transporter permease [Tissierellia bacterium]|nr:sugar ABC transporter permease [Tissierellia bacterium]
MNKTKKKLIPILFVLPALIMLTVFIFYPLVQNFINSVYEFSAFSPTKTFVGSANFKELLKDKVVATALKNNFRYAVISVIFQVFGGMTLAAILEQKVFRKFAPAFRIIYFMPVVISITVIALLFSFVYHPQIGLLNSLLKNIGLGNLAKPWLGNSKTAIYAVIAVSQWQSIGYIMMLFIVAIQKIPGELYEAAELDGASKIQQFFYVTIPQVRETLFVTTLITITGSMLVFNEPYILTSGGGPGTSSITMSIHMYQMGFLKDRMGYASTLALVIFIITAILAVIQQFAFKTGDED